VAAESGPAGGVPAGYELERERGVEIVALPCVMRAVRDAVGEAHTLYDWAERWSSRSFVGRAGAAFAVVTPCGEWVVRHYRRGGVVARMLGDRYVRAGEPRPLRELRASVLARTRGVATPEVVAAAVYPAGLVYRADLATRYVPDSADLADTVLGPARGGVADRVEAWRAAGALLRIAFRAGVAHPDLNMRNILIQRTAGGRMALLLDLDRAVVHDSAVSDEVRHSMLSRLQRSRRKLESVAGVCAGSEELAAFEEAVAGDDDRDERK
jgi:3-deoxy-D-manno-octulosonic acid kinase